LKARADLIKRSFTHKPQENETQRQCTPHKIILKCARALIPSRRAHAFAKLTNQREIQVRAIEARMYPQLRRWRVSNRISDC